VKNTFQSREFVIHAPDEGLPSGIQRELRTREKGEGWSLEGF
jgi:hypothetical protein